MQNERTYKNSRRLTKPLISCDFDYEKRGRRPRVVKIEETYYVTYTDINVMGALATSKDLIHFENME
jgi:predicted GH43/DUF377 family glycosyl hydrolase